MYDKARPKKLEKLRSAWAERAQNLRLQLRFWKKNIIGRAQGPRLSGGRSGPGPNLGHHNRTIRFILLYQDRPMFHHF